MRERIAKLVDVKTFVTFALIGTTCYLAVRNNVQLSAEFVASIVTAVVTYFFTRKGSESDGGTGAQ